ncbi:ribosome maturation factor RimP [Gemella sp. GH3]|uniref:ribosome maturation factor RimP n=1 Tax=unclassified Gemella TaxID=2624949 RepID=UPI0015D07492|nr:MULTISPECIES: ribosome maturation factor RimP [unclassified Gemella]MBF0714461.1 ribosome maturation factor RimP [Gemella sp. GH3.1]NYS51413.1 ribosome maturation factor RimP [Gemella sp. GH3]
MNLVSKVKEIALEKIKDTEYSLYDVEYVKEGTEYFLRIYFDKNGNLSLDDCVFLSEIMAEELDNKDLISDKYYLEVSSPGIERELRNIEEIQESIGKYIYVKTYEKHNNQKEFYGDLKSVGDENITIEYRDKARIKTITLGYKQIAKIRLAVKF